MTEQRIATIKKNALEEIRISLTEFNGYKLLNIRVWFKNDHRGEFRPGKAGLALRVELLPEFQQAIEQAVAEAQRLKLL